MIVFYISQPTTFNFIPIRVAGHKRTFYSYFLKCFWQGWFPSSPKAGHRQVMSCRLLSSLRGRDGFCAEIVILPWCTIARLCVGKREGDRGLKMPGNAHVASPVCTHLHPAPQPLLPLKPSPQCCCLTPTHPCPEPLPGLLFFIVSHPTSKHPRVNWLEWGGPPPLLMICSKKEVKLASLPGAWSREAETASYGYLSF